MEFLKPPDPLRFSGDISRNWKLFIQKFNLFLASSETTDQKPRPESAKGALLLSITGEEAIEVYNTFTFAEGESNLHYATVVKKFEEYCDAQQNEVYERNVFRKRVQEPGEPFEHFLRDLKTQARACNFGALTDSMVRDQIVFGTRDAKLREKLLADNKLTLENAEKTCKAAEISAAHQEAWYQDVKQVDPVRKQSPVARSEWRRDYKCRKCGRTHEPRNCPAFGKPCRKCKKKNHFAVCCRASASVDELEESEDDFDVLEISVNKINSGRDWTVEARVNNASVQLKVDTGSEANLLPFGPYKKMHPKPPLQSSSAVLRSYGGGLIKHLGVIRAEVEICSRKTIMDFFIVRNGRQAILGLQACEQAGLLSRRVHSVSENSSQKVVKDFPHLFSGTGCVQRRYRMVLREGAKPVVQTTRRVPLALQEPLKGLH